jgi:hypothetical protein
VDGLRIESRLGEAGTDRPGPSWMEGLFSCSSPVVNTNDWCVGLVRCAVGNQERDTLAHQVGG